MFAHALRRQKDALYAGKSFEIVAEFDRPLARIPRTNPGNKFRREKLSEVRAYMAKREHGMNYHELLETRVSPAAAWSPWDVLNALVDGRCAGALVQSPDGDRGAR